MSALETRTERIIHFNNLLNYEIIKLLFNNLTKQNEKLGSDSVLIQSTTVSSVQSPASKV